MPEEIAETIVHNIPDWYPSSYDDVVELRARITRAIRDAYERAAEVAEACNDVHPGRTPHVIAARIRALKGETA